MGFSTILRRSVSRVVPMATRTIETRRYNHHCAVLFSAVNRRDLSSKIFRSSFPSVLNYSTTRPSSDESLIRVIQTEIECAAEDSDQEEEAPEGFPFKIQDNPGQQTISLSREYRGETIDVEVHMPDFVTDEGDDDKDKKDDEDDDGTEFSLPLVVRVSKKGRPSLEFGCAAGPGEISIDSLSIKDPNADDQIAYDGPDFSDLDDNLQKALHNYLEIRGIKPSTAIFLHQYMITKDGREYLMWLKNLKKFIEA